MKVFPFLLLLILLAHCSSTAGGQTDGEGGADGDPTVFYLLRHAEKDSVGGDDPALLPAGERRAANLAERLGDEPVAAVYATAFRRTEGTARPLAERLSLPVTTYDAGQPARLVTEWKQQYRGRTIVVVGHSNSTPTLLNELIGENTYPPLSEEEYSMLYRVTIGPSGVATVQEERTQND